MPHPKLNAITALLGDGLSNAAIARELGCDRHAVGDIRRALALPNVPRQPLTLEQKWATFTRELPGGHVEWTGERQKTSGTPLLRHREQAYTAARVAFRIGNGREPQGYTYADCGLKHCVAPGHVEDEPMRIRAREQLRYLGGGPEHKTHCAHGHDLSTHVRYEPDGVAYCSACKSDSKRRGQRTPPDIPGHGVPDTRTTCPDAASGIVRDNSE
ncbi:hypothetical protein [Streptomyces sp. G1]|uniref:hypothetical protein n=1 Tax=Streptomyces sp. G1 TaxID=361572 RepID=UPI00202EE36B|nr:hypothetical protein [Streptomyces sp. G1]MCM1964863.1 hypothetical protein [Streptomyces sp. G1]